MNNKSVGHYDSVTLANGSSQSGVARFESLTHGVRLVWGMVQNLTICRRSSMVEQDSRRGCRNMRVRVLPSVLLETKMAETVACKATVEQYPSGATKPRDYM